MSTTEASETPPEFRINALVALADDFKDPAEGVTIKEGSIGKVVSVMKTRTLTKKGGPVYKYRVNFTNPVLGEYSGINEDILSGQ